MVDKLQGGRGRVQKVVSRETGNRFKAERPATLIPQLVYELLMFCESACDAGPDERRARLRDLRFRLARALPRVFPQLSDSALAQALAEEDGEDIVDETTEFREDTRPGF